MQIMFCFKIGFGKIQKLIKTMKDNPRPNKKSSEREKKEEKFAATVVGRYTMKLQAWL